MALITVHVTTGRDDRTRERTVEWLWLFLTPVN
jgi:hypothetical protein